MTNSNTKKRTFWEKLELGLALLILVSGVILILSSLPPNLALGIVWTALGWGYLAIINVIRDVDGGK